RPVAGARTGTRSRAACVRVPGTKAYLVGGVRSGRASAPQAAGVSRGVVGELRYRPIGRQVEGLWELRDDRVIAAVGVTIRIRAAVARQPRDGVDRDADHGVGGAAAAGIRRAVSHGDVDLTRAVGERGTRLGRRTATGVVARVPLLGGGQVRPAVGVDDADTATGLRDLHRVAQCRYAE